MFSICSRQSLPCKHDENIHNLTCRCWAESREELKYNLDVVDWLIRSNLLNMQLLDEHLARTLDDPRLPSYIPSFFIMQLVQVC